MANHSGMNSKREVADKGLYINHIKATNFKDPITFTDISRNTDIYSSIAGEVLGFALVVSNSRRRGYILWN